MSSEGERLRGVRRVCDSDKLKCKCVCFAEAPSVYAHVSCWVQLQKSLKIVCVCVRACSVVRALGCCGPHQLRPDWADLCLCVCVKAKGCLM